MATQAKEQTDTGKKSEVAKIESEAATTVKPLAAFWKKFGNDWSFNLAAALAYNLLMAIFPFALALLAILGLIVGSLNHATYVQLTNTIAQKVPGTISTVIQGTLTKQQHQLALESSILAVVAIILSLYNGSRLFVLIEGCFGIIYRVRQRAFVQQNLMAFGMLLLFIILIPIMAVGSTIPTFAQAIVKSLFGSFPGISVLVAIIGILGSLIPSYILFQCIYLIVPNQHISWKHSWRGALVAAVLLQIYLTLFPVYVAHFLTGYASSIASVLVLLIFFYYYAIILFLGAEVNAFFGEGITNSPSDVVTLIKEATEHRLQTQHSGTSQHNGTSTKTVQTAAAHTAQGASLTQPSTTIGANSQVYDEKQAKKMAKQQSKATPSKGSITIVTIVGAALAVLIEWLRIRKT